MDIIMKIEQVLAVLDEVRFILYSHAYVADLCTFSVRLTLMDTVQLPVIRAGNMLATMARARSEV